MNGIVQGAYVTLPQLLALRYTRQPPTADSSRVVGSRTGAKLSKIKGRGVDFAEVRLYQPGDDIRTIDWNVTARKNKPHTKVFREERERPTLIVVDQTQNMFFGSRARLKSVAAAEVAARIAWQTLAAGDRVGGVVIGNDELKVHRPYRTTKAVARLMNDIVTFNNALAPLSEWVPAMENGLLQVRRLARSNYRIVIVSDFAGPLELWQDQLHQLARHNQVLAVHVHDPLERNLPPSDHYLVTDGVERLQFYSGDKRLRQRYQDRFAARQAELMQLCLHDRMRYLDVATDNGNLDQYAWV